MWKETSPTVKEIEYPMAADPSGEVSRAYGVWQKDSGLNKRGTFIIDPEGIIRGVELMHTPAGRSVEELIRKIMALQAVVDNPGMAAPAGWKPGEDLISTDQDWIGEY